MGQKQQMVVALLISFHLVEPQSEDAAERGLSSGVAVS